MTVPSCPIRRKFAPGNQAGMCRTTPIKSESRLTPARNALTEGKDINHPERCKCLIDKLHPLHVKIDKFFAMILVYSFPISQLDDDGSNGTENYWLGENTSYLETYLTMTE